MKPLSSTIIIVLIVCSVNTYCQWQLTQNSSGRTSFLSVGDTILASNYNGFYAMHIKDTIWKLRSDTLHFDLCAVDNNKIISATNKGLFISYDYGYNWEFLDSTWTTADYLQYLSLLYTNDTIWVATWDSVCMSANNGKDWILIRKDDNFNFLTLHTNRVYLSTMAGSIEYTTNGGESWIIDAQADNNVWDASFLAFSDSYMFAGGQYSISRRKVNESQWEKVQSIDLSDYGGMEDICVDGDTIYIAADDGLLISKDNGNTWGFVSSDEFDSFSLDAVEVFQNYIFVVTDFYVWKHKLPLDIGATTSISLLTNNDYIIIYPNPVRSTISVENNGKMDQNWKLKLLDNNGRVITETILPSNQKKVLVPVSDIPQGIYIVEVSSNDKTCHKKIIIY